jgi:hypothetical protein
LSSAPTPVPTHICIWGDGDSILVLYGSDDMGALVMFKERGSRTPHRPARLYRLSNTEYLASWYGGNFHIYIDLPTPIERLAAVSQQERETDES